MMTFVALLVLATAQLALVWLARELTRALLPVAEGPRKAARFAGRWVLSGIGNTVILGAAPNVIEALLATWLEPFQRGVDGVSAALTAVGWLYPVWVQVRGPQSAG